MRSSDLRIPAHLLPKIGGMATMPSRAATLRMALPGILAQVDRLYLYLDRQSAVPPDLASMPKLVCMLPKEGRRSLGTAGKFLALSVHPEPCLFFGFDDDIAYAPGYVALLAGALRRHHYRAIVGLHGAVYHEPLRSYVKDRAVLRFQKALRFDVVVDELGTGVMAFHSCALDIEPQRWTHPNMADLHLMIEAVRQETPRICARRPVGMATPLAEDQDDSLYRQSLLDDSAETAMLQAAMGHYPGRWCSSSRNTHTASCGSPTSSAAGT